MACPSWRLACNSDSRPAIPLPCGCHTRQGANTMNLMNAEQLEVIVSAVLTLGAVESAENTPKHMVNVFKETLDCLRKSGGIPPR